MSDESLSVFVSYASYDNKSDDPEKRWLDRLLQFLKPLNLDQSISIWADTELQTGENWKSEIRVAIERAKVAILLVSPAFLASDFIRTKELPQLLQNAIPPDQDNVEADEEDVSEEMLILPILIRPCLIEHVQYEIPGNTDETQTAKLSDFQYVPQGMAMNGLEQYEQDKQFEAIAKRIIDVLQLRKGQASNTIPSNELNQLGDLLVNFLNERNRWWFNALRIRNVAEQHSEFEIIGDYSIQQISEKLEELSKGTNAKISSKEGKKSKVYRGKQD